MNPTILALLVALVAAALAAASYFVGGTPERTLWPAVAGRAMAWAALALLLLNVGCPAALTTESPLVLLDVSPSMIAAGGQADLARSTAVGAGEVVEFGGSQLRDPLTTGVASGRAVMVVTDGEIVDASGIPPSLLAGATIEVLPRQAVPDVAIVGVEGSGHLAQGDTLHLVADLRAVGDSFPAGLSLEALAGETVLATAPVPEGPAGSMRVALATGPVALPAGQHMVSVRLVGGADAEPRTDQRLHHLTVSATPGIVLVANPATWDSRFLYRTLVAVAGLPVEGYLQVVPGSWRRMSDLRPVAASAVQAAVQGADLLVSFGSEPAGAGSSRARGRWLWPNQAATEGDWYPEVEAGSPLAAAFGGVTPDSLLPADGLIVADPPAGSWTALSVRLGRRGAPRPAISGSDGPGGRRIVVGASGLWRWAFFGGIQEQAYRGWVAGSVTWLLGRPTSSTEGVATPVRPVVERDAPVAFQWSGGAAPMPIAITLASPAGQLVDTLRFDGSGRATLSPGVGAWSYTLDSGDTGLIAVEEYSSEFIPGPQTLESRQAQRDPQRRNRGSREFAWLFALAIAGWCLEWAVRRRAGMR